MKKRKKSWISYLKTISWCLTIASQIRWLLPDANAAFEPGWLFYASLLVSIILTFVDWRARQRPKRQVADYEDLGPTPATYEQVARDREQRKFRLGAYRTTIRESLSEEAFVRQLRHQAERLGFQPPEIQADGDSRRVLIRSRRLLDNPVNHAVVNMEFDITRLNDTGEVDVCAWEPSSTWILCAVVAASGFAGEVICIIHKVPFWFQLLIILVIGYAFAAVPINTRITAKRALRDLHLEQALLFTAETEDEP